MYWEEYCDEYCDGYCDGYCDEYCDEYCDTPPERAIYNSWPTAPHRDRAAFGYYDEMKASDKKSKSSPNRQLSLGSQPTVIDRRPVVENEDRDR